jgi:hypothetical protein
MRRMKTITTLAGLCTTLLLTLCLNALPHQDNPEQQAPVPAEKTFEGHLTKVNIEAKLITVKGDDDKEIMFVFNNDTAMTGVENSPQGLTGKTGTRLKITYRESRGINLATKIEASATEPHQ